MLRVLWLSGRCRVDQLCSTGSPFLRRPHLPIPMYGRVWSVYGRVWEVRCRAVRAGRSCPVHACPYPMYGQAWSVYGDLLIPGRTSVSNAPTTCAAIPASPAAARVLSRPATSGRGTPRPSRRHRPRVVIPAVAVSHHSSAGACTGVVARLPSWHELPRRSAATSALVASRTALCCAVSTDGPVT